jgi:two-component system sensor histidine kinase CpxA
MKIRRSITIKILFWSTSALVLSLAAFIVMWAISARHIAPYVGQMFLLEREDTVEAYKAGGKDSLTEHIARLERYIAMRYYLTSSNGTDLITGQDKSALIHTSHNPLKVTKDLIIVLRSPNDPYCFIVIMPVLGIWTFLPFYLLVPCTVILLGWILTVKLASPLKKAAVAVEAFGQGDYSVRINSNRVDEIGEVANAFDRMAERIETLLHAERLLLQDISHELRSPLTRIRFAAALTKTAKDREKAAHDLEREIVRLTELVNGLLAVTRLEADPNARGNELCDLVELAAHVVDACGLDAGAHKCCLRIEVQGRPVLQGDPELLRRAVENVVRNAIKYSPSESEVIISVRNLGEVARIDVRDFGPGAPEELLSKIFQPFFRVDSSRSSTTGGVGLGLSIAQRAVNAHGGSISAVNANPGLLLRIELPTVV